MMSGILLIRRKLSIFKSEMLGKILAVIALKMRIVK